MKSKRALLFRALTVFILLAVAGAMFILGRGHTVYLDNKTIDYNGETYTCPYKVVVYVGDEQVAKLYAKERGMAPCIGQTFKMRLELTKEKGGEEVMLNVTMSLPYNMDGVVINLPALLNGLPEEAYLSEFVSLIPDEPVEEDVVVDEFALPEADTAVPAA